MRIATIRREQHLRIDYIRGSKPATKLAVTFSHWAPPGRLSLTGPGYSGWFLLENGYDLVAFKANRNWWFQDLDDADFARVNAIVDLSDRRYATRVGYGSSMGAYAALQFARPLRLDRVLALSPQFALSQPWDTRWHDEMALVEIRHRLTPDAVAPGCAYFICFDPIDRDRFHVRRYAEILPVDRLTLYPVPYAGHPAAEMLNEGGVLKAVALGILDEGRPPGRRLIRDARRRSERYLHLLSLHCWRRRKHAWALAAIDRAIALAPDRAALHGHRSAVLDSLGRPAEAIDAARQAAALSPREASRHAHLSRLLARAGNLDEALAAIDRAIAIDEASAAWQRHRAHLVQRRRWPPATGLRAAP